MSIDVVEGAHVLRVSLPPVPVIEVTPRADEDTGGFTPGIHCAMNRMGLWRVFAIASDGSKVHGEVIIKHHPETGRYHVRVENYGSWSRPILDPDVALKRATLVLMVMNECDLGRKSFSNALIEWNELMFN